MPSIMKVTLPRMLPDPDTRATAAVKVTEVPRLAGLLLEESVVTVAV
jgi:hypothetical protein